MAFDLTQVASPLAVPPASTRRPVGGNPTSGQPAAKAATAISAAQVNSSFQSLLARSSAAQEPAAATSTVVPFAA